MPKVEKKSSAISTLWNARDHIKFVQNKLGGVVGTLESLKVSVGWTLSHCPLYIFCPGCCCAEFV